VPRLPEVDAEARDHEEQRQARDGDPHDVRAELLEPFAGEAVRRRDHGVAERHGEGGRAAQEIDRLQPDARCTGGHVGSISAPRRSP
jgi:hypothetical protein